MSYQRTDAISAQAGGNWSPPAAASNSVSSSSMSKAASQSAQLQQMQAAMDELQARMAALQQMQQSAASSAIMAMDDTPARTAAAAALATAQAPYEAALHELLARYHGDVTPMGAAYRVWKHLESKTTHGMRITDAIRELARDVDLLSVVATASAAKSVPISYTMDGGELVATISPGSADPWMLIAQAADALVTHYLGIPESERALIAPGVIAMKTKALSEPAPCKGERVHVVANHTDVATDYRNGVNALTPPHYKLVAIVPGLPNGVPFGSGSVCNEGVPGGKSVTVVSMSDGKQKKRTVLLDAPASHWDYTEEAKVALLTHVYDALSTTARAVGDSHSETAAAALHKGITERAAAVNKISAKQPMLSRS